VERAHLAAKRLRDEGDFVVVVGRRDHVEVRGLVGDLERFAVVASPDEVITYPGDRIGVIAQTTSTDRQVSSVHAAVVERNPRARVRLVDTVCQPTRDHQRALERLLGRVEAVVVVGGRNSNNTRALAARCRERGVPAVHVQGPEDLDPDFFAGRDVIGLTAGTSTLDETIDGVHRALLSLGSVAAACS
jgi:4-hydroxy-3-methylbut-2-enyl diphosphate reductase